MRERAGQVVTTLHKAGTKDRCLITAAGLGSADTGLRNLIRRSQPKPGN